MGKMPIIELLRCTPYDQLLCSDICQAQNHSLLQREHMKGVSRNQSALASLLYEYWLPQANGYAESSEILKRESQ